MSAAAFPGSQRIVVTQTARSALSMTRFRPDIRQGEMHVVGMAAEDAFVILFQLRSHPAHEFMSGGKLERVGAAPSLTLNVVTLGEGDVGGRLAAPVDTLLIHLPRPALDEITEEAGAKRIDILRAPDPWRTRDPVLERIHPLLLNALSDQEPANGLLYDHWLLGLATHVAYRYGGISLPRRLARGGLAPWQEKRTKELLSANLAGAASLREIAAECQLSPDHLSRAFKISTGVTPHQWLQAHRVDSAKTMLVTTRPPFAEIAGTCGFSDQSHLSRVFSRHAGSSPGAWRRQRR
jgi:AraC family transcriptional regulator